MQLALFKVRKSYSFGRYALRVFGSLIIAAALMVRLAHGNSLAHVLAAAVILLFFGGAYLSWQVYRQREKEPIEFNSLRVSDMFYTGAPFFYMVGWLLNALVSVLAFFIALAWG